MVNEFSKRLLLIPMDQSGDQRLAGQWLADRWKIPTTPGDAAAANASRNPYTSFSRQKTVSGLMLPGSHCAGGRLAESPAPRRRTRQPVFGLAAGGLARRAEQRRRMLTLTAGQRVGTDAGGGPSLQIPSRPPSRAARNPLPAGAAVPGPPAWGGSARLRGPRGLPFLPVQRRRVTGAAARRHPRIEQGHSGVKGALARAHAARPCGTPVSEGCGTPARRRPHSI